ncbi:hypothetical protein IFO70_30375 [Phormidium tenue FACHB-886]|nr:hypothetical protein [Phormidium tenue FACHB-886]
MAILVKDLGSECNLFFDSESYLDAVGEDKLRAAIGGATPATIGAYVLTTAVIGGTGAGFGALVYYLAK